MRQAHNLLKCMGLCHTAIVSRKKSNLNGEFISESEDELTLLQAAKQIGFRFLKRDTSHVYLRVNNEDHVFKFKGLLPFDSERKVMSIVVEDIHGETYLFSKGADSAILKMCTLTNSEI